MPLFLAEAQSSQRMTKYIQICSLAKPQSRKDVIAE